MDISHGHMYLAQLVHTEKRHLIIEDVKVGYGRFDEDYSGPISVKILAVWAVDSSLKEDVCQTLTAWGRASSNGRDWFRNDGGETIKDVLKMVTTAVLFNKKYRLHELLTRKQGTAKEMQEKLAKKDRLNELRLDCPPKRRYPKRLRSAPVRLQL